jgi:glycosyltransferase involved in cell wall biosynthesis
MKIAFVNDGILVCGGMITNFEYVKELKSRGYEADIYANYLCDTTLTDFYNIKPKHIEELQEYTKDDVIIANWWPQVNMLEQYKGKKIQFVQGKDIDFYSGEAKRDCLETRQNKNWNIIAVSKYALEWTERQGDIIPNGVGERFFKDYGEERDIDALVEGIDEPNKNIHEAIRKAKEDGHKKIVWLARETHSIPGVETITNPPQEEIPKIYQRAKHFYKYSHSEGFCLPLLEAMASGCEIHTHDMGGNDFKPYTKKNALRFTWEKATDKLLLALYKI